MRYYILFLLLFFGAPAAHAVEYDWHVVKVIDGDTLKIKPSFMQNLNWYVRVRGVDTPEKRLPKCPQERQLAMKASEFTTSLVNNAKVIEFKQVKHDKYGGRFNADVYIDGKSLAALLIEEKLAYKYNGGKKTSWCSTSSK